MAVVLNVTSTPQVFSANSYSAAATAINTGIYRFTITPTQASVSSVYSGFHAIFGQASGGVWLADSAVELYTSPGDALCFSQAITFLANQTITITIDTRSGTRSVRIAGATLGNGTFTFATGGPYIDPTQGLEVGQFTSGQFLFTGTIGSVDDTVNSIACAGGTLALTGGSATLRAARKVPVAGGSLALTGGSSSFLTGKTINVATGSFALTGGSATFRRALRSVTAGGSYALTGGDALFALGSTLTIGAHGIDFQTFGSASRNASVTLNTQPTGSMIITAAGGKSSDVTQAWTSNKGTISKVAAVVDYSDYAGYGTQVGKTATGGTGHVINVPVTNFDENTTFVTEVLGGRRVKTVNTNVANASGTSTLISGTIATDGPAMLIADWWGASPTVPPFSGSPSVGTPYTAVPNNGFTVLDSYLVNNQDGEVQACRAYLAVSSAGSYNVTWTHTPVQGGQTWLTAVLPAATVLAGGGTLALTGGSATLRAARKVPVAGGSLAVTGGSAAFTIGHALVVDSGAYTFSGGVATLRAARRILPTGGSVTLVGGSASLTASRTIQVAGGTLLLSGGQAVIRAARVLSGVGSALALTGGASSMIVSRTIISAGGNATLTGGDALLRITRVLGLAGGVFAMTGGATTLVSGRAVILDPGSFALTCGPALLRHSRVVASGPGSLVLTGAVTTLRAARRIVPAGGALALTGGVMSMDRSSSQVVLLGGTLALTGGPATFVLPNTGRHKAFSTRRTTIRTRQTRVVVRS